MQMRLLSTIATPTLPRVILFITATLVVLFTIASNCTAASGPSSTHSAVEHGLQFLQKEAFRCKTTKTCAACHHAMTTLWTFNDARACGYDVDQVALKE